MTRHALAQADATFDAVLKEAESGPVELVRAGEAIAVVLTMADYKRLVEPARKGFFAALEASRAAMNAEGVDLSGAFDDVRDVDPGRPVHW